MMLMNMAKPKCRYRKLTMPNTGQMTITKKDFSIMVTLLSLLLFSGCFYDEGLAEIIPEDTIVSYAFDIQPIFDANCTSCHPLVISTPDLTSGNSYEAIMMENYIISKDEDGSILYQRLLGKPNLMPPSGPLPQLEIDLVKKWIEQGALNN